MLYVKCFHSCEVAMPAVGLGYAVNQIDGDIVKTALLCCLHGLHRLLCCVTAIEEFQIGIGKGLHPDAQPIHAQCFNLVQVFFGKLFGIGLESKFFQLRQIVATVECVQNFGELRRGEQRGRAAAKIQCNSMFRSEFVLAQCHFGAEGVHIGVDVGLAFPWQRIKGAIEAFLPAKRYVDVDHHCIGNI